MILPVAAVLTGCGCNGDEPPKPTTPSGLIAIHGEFYRGEMGSATLDQPLQFAVADNSGGYVPGQWVHFALLEGDGDLSADSIKTGSDGKATLAYTFSGSLGHATIRAVARNLDTIYVYLRANVLIFGDHGQGQYVLLDDAYQDVLDFNGPPVSLDAYPQLGIVVANYESTLGVVVVIYDTDENGIIEPTSPVYEVIVVDSVDATPPDSPTKAVRYEGTTVEGIGIGSHWLNDVRPVYGFPNFLVFEDTLTPPTIKVIWDALHLTLWTRHSDSTAYQIDVAETYEDSLYQSSSAAEISDSVMRAIRQQNRRNR